jgi:AcrR family transcriptional regulator
MSNMRKVRTYSSDTQLVNERRSHIVKVAAKLIMKKGYNNINTRELAIALGMSTGGLYHYIGSKEDILYLLINFTADLTGQTLAHFAQSRAGTDAVGEIKGSLRYYLETVDGYRDFVNFVNHIMLSLAVSDRKIVYEAEGRLVEYFESVLQRGIAEGSFLDHDPKLVAHNMVAVATAWANRGWYLKNHYTLEQYITEQTDTVLSQIRTRAALPGAHDTRLSGSYKLPRNAVGVIPSGAPTSRCKHPNA